MQTLTGDFEEALRRAANGSVVAAIGLIICGIIAIATPLAGAVAATVLFGSVAIVAGALELAVAWRTRHDGGAFWRFALGVAYVAVGVWVLVNPGMGVVAIAFALGATLIARGVMQFIVAYQLRETHVYGWFIVDGLVALGVGALVLAAWPAGSVLFLGIWFGASLLMNGAYRLVVSSLLRRSLPPAQKPMTAAHA